MKPVEIHPLSLLLGATILGGVLSVSSWQHVSSTRQWNLTGEQAEILSHMSIVYLDDGAGNPVNKTIRISGVNVQIVNGLGATNGYPTDPSTDDPNLTVTDGVGNLIVGYNEVGLVPVDNRTGSHNIIVGTANTYSAYGGLVVGAGNATTGAWSSVCGGVDNTASGIHASVCGGERNTASGDRSTVGGGQDTNATGGEDWAAGTCYWCDQ